MALRGAVHQVWLTQAGFAPYSRGLQPHGQSDIADFPIGISPTAGEQMTGLLSIFVHPVARMSDTAGSGCQAHTRFYAQSLSE